MEQALGGPYLPVAMLPEKDKLLLAKMESRLPLEIFEEVLRAATDACQQVSYPPPPPSKRLGIALFQVQVPVMDCGDELM